VRAAGSSTLCSKSACAPCFLSFSQLPNLYSNISNRYFLFLLVNVVFIFLLASTYLQLLYDLANFPAKIPEKIAKALQAGKARNFFLSYVILQGESVLSSLPVKLT
jgi:hypothetical protein